LGDAPIGKLLLGFCTQSTMSVMMYSVFVLTDTFFISISEGAYAAGAVALAAPFLMILGAIKTTVGAGGASVISRALGAGDTKKAAVTTGNCFMIFWFFALLVTVFGLIFLSPLTKLLGASGVLYPYAKDYLRVIIIGSLTSTGFSSLIRAEGNARFAMYIWIVPVAANFILDPIFIIWLRLGVVGAGIATVIAQSISAGMCIWYFFFRRNRSYTISLYHMQPKGKEIREILSVGAPTFISQTGMSIYMILLNNTVGRLGGDTILAAYGIVSRLVSFFVMPFTGIVQGAQPIIGFNYAAKKIDRMKKAIRLSISASIIYGLIAAVAAWFLARILMTIFTDNEIIIYTGATILPIIALCFPLRGTLPIVSATFQAQGYPLHSLILSFGGMLAVQLPLLYIFAHFFGLNGLWYSFIAGESILFIISLIVITRSQRLQGVKNSKELRTPRS